MVFVNFSRGVLCVIYILGDNNKFLLFYGQMQAHIIKRETYIYVVDKNSTF